MKQTVSVVMATYNGEKYIRKQLDSIVSQTIAIDEVLISDDNSTDHTYDIIDEYIHMHNLINWHLLKNEKNEGYKKNFKKLLSLSTGNIVFLCDQDDIWDFHKVENMVKAMSTIDSCEVLCSKIKLIDAQDQEIPQKKNSWFTSNNGIIKFPINKGGISKVPLNEIFVRNITPGCAIAIKQEVIKQFTLLYNECIPHDWFISIMASLLHDSLYYIDVATTMYRIHDNNTIGIKSENSNFLKRKLNLLNQELGLISLFPIQYDKKQLFLKLIKKRINYYKMPTISQLLALIFAPSYHVLYNKRQICVDFLYMIRGKHEN